MSPRTPARLAVALALAGLLGAAAGCSSDPSPEGASPSGGASCPGPADGGEAQDIKTAKLYIEHNATDADTGVHGAFDDDGWSVLCVLDPDGNEIWALEPRSQLGDLGVAGVFFESREPPGDQYPVRDLYADFPEGEYQVWATAHDGSLLGGAARFTHSIPAPPTILDPPLVADLEESAPPVVAAEGLVVRWDPVRLTIDDGPADIAGYEVIITKEVDDDPNGFSRPTLDVHVGPDSSSLPVPDGFLEPSTPYELEVLSIEASGNQTISVGFFETA